MKPAVQLYTAITGGRDKPRDDILTFSAYDRFRDPRLNAKIYKVLPHLFVQCEWSIWVDGHIEIGAPIDELMALAEDHEFAVMRHPDRDCIYDEASECIRRQLDDEQVIREQVARYRTAGYPSHNGLAACTVIIRRHTPQVQQACESWWAEICRGSVRDQISFPYAVKDYFAIDANIFDNPWFRWRGHARPRPSVIQRARRYARRTARKAVRALVPHAKCDS